MLGRMRFGSGGFAAARGHHRARRLSRIVLVLVAALLLLATAGCSSSSSDSSTSTTAPISNANKLAELQQGGPVDPSDSLVQGIQMHLSSLVGKCREHETKLAGIINFAHDDLAKHGIAATMASLAENLDTGVPAGEHGFDCTGVEAALLTLREG